MSETSVDRNSETPSATMTLADGRPAKQADARTLLEEIRAEVGKVIVGHDEAVELLLTAAFAGGHVLIEGPPGMAKTLLAGSVARGLGVGFVRIQFTPDTAPTHVTGTSVLKMGEPVFVPGAVFTNVVLADEINRTPARTQAALLEAMQEGHVTVDGTAHWLPSPFMVIATQNPYEHEGVFPLPESQLDRFLFKIHLSYGNAQEEVEVVKLPRRGLTLDIIGDIRPLLGPVQLDRAQRELDATCLPDPVARYIVALARRTRELSGVVLGASPRAAVHLAAAAKASARLAGRDTVRTDDVARMAPFVLSHRLVLDEGSADEVVRLAVESAARY